MDKEIEEKLQIRYIKLHFYLCIDEEAILPVHKSSALRGGMGEMLLRNNCIKDRNCEDCSFKHECIVQRIMYSEMKIRPSFMSRGDSVGYILNCEDKQEHFYAGDILKFDLTLFGNTIVYFNQILQAFYMLGQSGIGKNKAHFHITKVTNSNDKILMDGQNVYMSEYTVKMVADYVKYRENMKIEENRMLFHTPVSVKYKGDMIKNLDVNAIIAALYRRIYILDCFEGIETNQIDYDEYSVFTVCERTRRESVRRYSSRHDESMYFNGISGYLDIDYDNDTLHQLLIAGELLHIGKNTSFGFGRYSMVKRNDKRITKN